MRDSLWTAAGLGAVTGSRSLLALAMVSRELSDRRVLFNAGRLERWLANDMVAITLSGLALAELVADKLPGVPARVQPAPLMGRMVIGGVLGAVAAGRHQRAVGAVLGAAAAGVATAAAWFLRGEAVRVTLLPDPALAIAEDAVAAVTGRELARAI